MSNITRKPDHTSFKLLPNKRSAFSAFTKNNQVIQNNFKNDRDQDLHASFLRSIKEQIDFIDRLNQEYQIKTFEFIDNSNNDARQEEYSTSLNKIVSVMIQNQSKAPENNFKLPSMNRQQKSELKEDSKLMEHVQNNTSCYNEENKILQTDESASSTKSVESTKNSCPPSMNFSESQNDIINCFQNYQMNSKIKKYTQEERKQKIKKYKEKLEKWRKGLNKNKDQYIKRRIHCVLNLL